MIKPANLLISRTDSIGDVILTLPMVGLIKQYYPDICIGFIGTSYTKAVIDACALIDVFIDQDEFLAQPVKLFGAEPECIIHVLPRSSLAKRAKQLRIRYRIGTTNRIYHWTTCNRLVPLSRKNSELHEAQLNLKLLQPLGIKSTLSLPELASLTALQQLPPLPERFKSLLRKDKFKLILHPKSRGSAREWDLAYFAELITSLDADKYQIFISGTESEKEALKPLLAQVGDRVIDISGQLNLTEFIAFIAACDGIIACSTGPLHIAAALQKHALGIYPPMRPIHPGRWQPIGTHAQVFVVAKECNACRVDKSVCACMQAIKPSTIKFALDKLYAEEFPALKPR